MAEMGPIIGYRVCVFNKRLELIVQVELGTPGVSLVYTRLEAHAQAAELKRLWGEDYIIEVQPVYEAGPDLVIDCDSEEGVNGAEGR